MLCVKSHDDASELDTSELSDVGSKVEYDSIVNDSAVLHLSYRVTKVEKGCIAWLDLENFKIC